MGVAVHEYAYEYNRMRKKENVWVRMVRDPGTDLGMCSGYVFA